MEIPYTIETRPDTGVYNAKLGIWLFLASELMLFGALFSAYILLRVGAEPGMWPHGWLDVRLGAINTLLLALSAITTLLAWAACKVRQFGNKVLCLDNPNAPTGRIPEDGLQRAKRPLALPIAHRIRYEVALSGDGFERFSGHDLVYQFADERNRAIFAGFDEPIGIKLADRSMCFPYWPLEHS